jgi:hypothetical protein
MRLRASCFMLLACTISSIDLSAQEAEVIKPMDAVMRAAEAAENKRRVHGVFEMVVRATGQEDSTSYLNSELDYRDQRNLTAVILPSAAPALKEKYGDDFLSGLKGKRIRITGAAQRVTIRIYIDGKRTDKYYFQTHVQVSQADQITVVGN